MTDDAVAEAARAVVRRLRDAGHEAYWAGGCVRDMLLGRRPKDYDVATSARPEQILSLFPGSASVGAAFGVVQVPLDGARVEVATFRDEGPYLDGRHPASVTFADARADVARRDFTINGLLYDPLTDRVVDWVDGRRDLEARRVRTIGDPAARFQEDRLRMLRAVRLAAELDFETEPQTLAAIRRFADRIRTVSAERIRDELVRIFTGPHPGAGLRRLDESGLLIHILPEVAAMKGIPQPSEFHPEGDVFEHTARTLDALRSPGVVLAFGALLHDVGKPRTYQVRDRIRFDRHDEVGARIAEEVLRRLRFSARETEAIVELVREHMRFKEIPRMREAKRRRLFARPDFDDHLELHRADCLASHKDLTTYEWVQRARAALAPEEIRPPRLITGDDLIAMGMRPGPAFARILETVADAQLEGRVRSREEALELAARVAAEIGGGEPSRRVEAKPH
ncbi:MAG: CCA tRNA nucleotidyltransferase [Armatimonadota bacterium]|nr:CCA tRNA nucleotidyltransferase [Armatimonadota bacterium]MDR5697564.1 CCA tRNA nucleotidyltransferase [Armatimonadota bacterium]